MQQKREAQMYEKPQLVDYGTLVELTAACGRGHHEDGMHKRLDHSVPICKK